MSSRGIRVVHPSDEVKVTFGAGDEYRYLATGEETDGAYYLVEAIVPPGGGPPTPIQTREEEAFYILEDTRTFYGDEGEIEAGSGTYLNVPKGAKHRFRNNGDTTARMLFFCPAGIEGLFEDLGKMTPSEDLNSAITALNEIGAAYGVEYFLE